MMRKERNLRLAVSGILLLAVVAAGIGMYRADQKGNTKQDTQIRNEELAEETPLSDEETAEDEETESTDVNTSNAEAQMEGTEDEELLKIQKQRKMPALRMRQLQMRRLHRTCRKFCHLSILMTIPLWNGRYPAMS